MRENSLDPIRQVLGVHAKAIYELHERMHKIEKHDSGADLARVDAALRVLGRDGCALNGQILTLQERMTALEKRVANIVDILRGVRQRWKTPGREVPPNASFDTKPSDPSEQLPLASRPDS